MHGKRRRCAIAKGRMCMRERKIGEECERNKIRK
jgi:hypothetical protein